MYYTGIGSRNTPPEILGVMEDAGFRFARMGFVLRSGKANGADAAFQKGVQNFFYSVDKQPKEEHTVGRAEIYIPWNGFKGDPILQDWWDISLPYIDSLFPEEVKARDELVAELHPNVEALRKKPGAYALHSRNVHQVLGPNLSQKRPSSFCIYYAGEDEKGNPKGGTATAVNLCKMCGVRTLNLLHSKNIEVLHSFLNDLEVKRGIT